MPRAPTFVKPSLLYQCLQRQVQARPDAIAIVDVDRHWTYAEIDALVAHWVDNELAGLPPGAAFGWLGANSAAMVASLFACAQLHLRWVPLNWRLAAPELRAMARHAGLVRWHADGALTALEGEAPSAAPDGNHFDDLLLVYTSGTTGEPKGAVHTQAAVVANLRAAIDAQGLNENSRVLAVLPLFHVGGLCIQVLPTLAAGGTVKLHARFDAAAWLVDVAAFRATTSLMVPATMHAILAHPLWPTSDLSSLAFVSAGSSIVPLPLIAGFHARGVPVAQVYGATETGPVTMVLRPHDAMAHAGSVGRPALGVQVRLEDREVWVQAPNLARGYHRLPNDAAFEGGWFKTGDLATVDDAGHHRIVGRRKDVIISGGENIDPAEIENLVAGVEGVAECAVVGIPDARWGEVPVVVVVRATGAQVTEVHVRAAWVDRLARFKHPQRIVFVASLPKTALGKVQRSLLTPSWIDAGQSGSTPNP